VSQSEAPSPTFLWKPTSESSGKLVVLLPAPKYNSGNVKAVAVKFNGGSENAYNLKQNGKNGDRLHARFHKPGKAYGGSPVVVATLSDGSTASWKIPNGGSRYERRGDGASGPPPAPSGAAGGLAPNNRQGSGGRRKKKGPGGKRRAGKRAARRAAAAAAAAAGGGVAPGGGIGPGATNGILASLTAAAPGQKGVSVTQAGVLTIGAKLATYGPAKLAVGIQRAGQVIPVMNWQRQNDKDPSPLMFNAVPVAASMVQPKPGDFSAALIEQKIPVQAGDVVVLVLTGQFGNTDAQLYAKAG
jgi:hypothetical protein